MLCQRQDVARPLAQRRQGQREDIQAIEQVFAETPRRDFFTQVSVRRRQHAHVELNHVATAEAFDLTFLQHAQQLGLQRQAHLGDLVEQQRTALCLFELAGTGTYRTGEGAFLVAEQYRLEHVVRDRCAVDRNKGAVCTVRARMDIARQDFFAGTRLTADHHRRVARGDPVGQFDQLAGAQILGHHLAVLDLMMRQIALDLLQQVIDLERLGEVIDRTEFHRLDGLFDGAIGGHDQHRQILKARAQVAQ